MAQYGQVTQSHTVHGYARLVFWLHTAGTENPDTPKAHPNASNFHEYHSEHPKSSPRHPPDSSREHNMPTDNNKRQRTPQVIHKQHLSVILVVWQCLLASVVVCWHVMFTGDALGVSGGCLGGVWGHLEWHSFKSEVLGCVWGLSGFSVPAVWSQNTNLANP